MSLTTVHRTVQDCALQLLEYVASRTGLTEAVRKLQLARQFAASDDELKQLQLKWLPGGLQEWLLEKAIQVFGEPTWKYQDSLPPLPVPPLKNTLDKYLESVKPFVTAEEYKQTEAVVREFEEGVGQSLHQQLLERAKVKRNWIEEWWLDLVYLRSRHSLPLTSNIAGFIPTTDHMWPSGVEPEDQVPLYLWVSMHLWKLLRKEQIPVDKAVLTGQPFCMDQFRNMLSAHRIPGVTMDKIVSHFRTESEGPSPTHITVLCKGRVFKMECVDQEGEPLTPAELKLQLQMLKQQCENMSEGPHISALTAGNRTEWAKTREKMVEMDPVNAHNLSVIEKSIVVVAFDDAMPKDGGEALYQALVGSSRNRWFDHFNTGVVFKSGLYASNFEHSPADGMVAVYWGYFLFAQLQRIGPIQKAQVPARPVPEPEELVFTIDDEIRDAIVHTEETFIKQASDMELICPSFTDYGKKFIRSFQLHPDSYMQTALQLAYFRLHGKPAPTYESATLRQYYHGRTETVRSCTMEVVNWCKAMLDNTVPVEEKKELMMVALKKHLQIMDEAKSMLGCDRHLFGLQVLAQGAGIPLPSIFTDAAYTKSGGGGNFVLSTSLLGYTPCPGATSPMVHHGYGIFYNIQSDRIMYTISAWKSCKETSAEEMSASIQQSLRDMRQLLIMS
ncbi:peroxisomal carnitine O-octanoyltransferase-like isoform X1 [Branchiostoma floridae]|uniref:Peroxisomal carnitine O-octanoyltransferase n=1 Tax=Branchiostoma floridae TaxID=7739 RepID=A0A9J7LUH7_BRAFL|nr:peroxisomal carnitine O-octanoyltransferase-like isoform X1 [Branchiostoma floridae]XP_035688501.1 peroxisomal carnitine O-octanoyltransferase-like isoform X1 [Branchiostoma floridae]